MLMGKIIKYLEREFQTIPCSTEVIWKQGLRRRVSKVEKTQ
jgi:hypothetical protein